MDSKALDAFKNMGLYDDSDLDLPEEPPVKPKSKPKSKPSKKGKKVPPPKKKKKVPNSVHSGKQKK